MNIYEFIDELFSRFENSYSRENRRTKELQYMHALDDLKIDYDKLILKIDKEWKNNFVPPSGELRNLAKHCLIFDKASKYIHLKAKNPVNGMIISNWVFDYGVSPAKMINAINKIDPIYDGFVDPEKTIPHQVSWEFVDTYSME